MDPSSSSLNRSADVKTIAAISTVVTPATPKAIPADGSARLLSLNEILAEAQSKASKETQPIQSRHVDRLIKKGSDSDKHQILDSMYQRELKLLQAYETLKDEKGNWEKDLSRPVGDPLRKPDKDLTRINQQLESLKYLKDHFEGYGNEFSKKQFIDRYTNAAVGSPEHKEIVAFIEENEKLAQLLKPHQVAVVSERITEFAEAELSKAPTQDDFMSQRAYTREEADKIIEYALRGNLTTRISEVPVTVFTHYLPSENTQTSLHKTNHVSVIKPETSIAGVATHTRAVAAVTIQKPDKKTESAQVDTKKEHASTPTFKATPVANPQVSWHAYQTQVEQYSKKLQNFLQKVEGLCAIKNQIGDQDMTLVIRSLKKEAAKLKKEADACIKTWESLKSSIESLHSSLPDEDKKKLGNLMIAFNDQLARIQKQSESLKNVRAGEKSGILNSLEQFVANDFKHPAKFARAYVGHIKAENERKSNFFSSIFGSSSKLYQDPKTKEYRYATDNSLSQNGWKRVSQVDEDTLVATLALSRETFEDPSLTREFRDALRSRIASGEKLGLNWKNVLHDAEKTMSEKVNAGELAFVAGGKKPGEFIYKHQTTGEYRTAKEGNYRSWDPVSDGQIARELLGHCNKFVTEDALKETPLTQDPLVKRLLFAVEKMSKLPVSEPGIPGLNPNRFQDKDYIPLEGDDEVVQQRIDFHYMNLAKLKQKQFEAQKSGDSAQKAELNKQQVELEGQLEVLAKAQKRILVSEIVKPNIKKVGEKFEYEGRLFASVDVALRTAFLDIEKPFSDVYVENLKGGKENNRIWHNQTTGRYVANSSKPEGNDWRELSTDEADEMAVKCVMEKAPGDREKLLHALKSRINEVEKVPVTLNPISYKRWRENSFIKLGQLRKGVDKLEKEIKTTNEERVISTFAEQFILYFEKGSKGEKTALWRDSNSRMYVTTTEENIPSEKGNWQELSNVDALLQLMNYRHLANPEAIARGDKNAKLLDDVINSFVQRMSELTKGNQSPIDLSDKNRFLDPMYLPIEGDEKKLREMIYYLSYQLLLKEKGKASMKAVSLKKLEEEMQDINKLNKLLNDFPQLQKQAGVSGEDMSGFKGPISVFQEDLPPKA